MPRLKNLLIIGAGKAGRLLAHDIIAHHPTLTVVGFVDDTRARQRQVLGQIKDLPQLTTVYKIDEIIIAIPSADGTVIRRILLTNQANRIPIRLVPREQRVLRHNQVRYSDVKDIEAEDFLGRPIAKRDLHRLARWYKNKRVLVTGGAGSIGSEIARQLLEFGAKRVIIYDHSEFLCYNLQQQLEELSIPKRQYRIVIGTIANGPKLQRLITEERPQLIFHAAAYKHVHLMEINIDEAVSTNILGTKIVVDAALAARVPRLVFISTDKVVNPTSIMGATKHIAEQYVRSRAGEVSKCNIVRFGNVINSYGSVLPLFDRQIKDHRYVTLTDRRMKRYFMSIREAAHLVLVSALQATSGQIYILNMGDLISMEEVVLCLIRSKGLRPITDVKIKEIGQRPGEKMEEQLFEPHEQQQVRQTKLTNIWHLKTDPSTVGDINQVVHDLTEQLNYNSAPQDLRHSLEKIIPSLRQ